MLAIRIVHAIAIVALTCGPGALVCGGVPAPVDATSPQPTPPQLDYVCPMDRDIRSKSPGVCPRCGMKLVPGIPEFREYAVTMSMQPSTLKPGEKARFTFQVTDPETNQPVRDFEIVHEKLYHLFVVSQDLGFFIHEHPQMQADGSFEIDLSFPKPGFYRVLNDFYPASGTPQLISRALFVPGPGFTLAFAQPAPDVSAQRSENVAVELVTEPREPIAGIQTLMFFRLSPKDGIQPYL